MRICSGKSVSIKVESSEKIKNFDKYAILEKMLTEDRGIKPERLDSQFQDWIKILELGLLMGLRSGLLSEELCNLLKKSKNVFLPKNKYEFITEKIVDKDDILFNYFKNSDDPKYRV